MKFSRLAEYFETIEKTSSRLEITYSLSDLFKELPAADFDRAMYLLQGRVSPQFESIEFGIAGKMVAKAAIQAMNLDSAYFNKILKERGDIGTTVEEFKKQYTSFEAKDLTVTEVYDRLLELAKKGGSGSQQEKMSILAHLIRQLDPLSARYLVRIPLGIMRLGFSDMTVLDAFSWMLKGDKSLRPEIEGAYHVRPDLGYIGKRLKEHGEKGVRAVKPEIFTPILMMRAERLSSGVEIIEKIGECAIEPKFDGFRLQAHVKKHHGKTEVRLYSRNLEDVGYMYPDVVAGIVKQITVNEAIFEGEAIGFDPLRESFLPFQETVSRKRKHGIEEKALEIPLRMFVFELLYADGVNYMQTPFKDRRKLLSKVIKTKNEVKKDVVLIADDEITDDPKKVELLFEDAIERGLEGILAKKLDGTYRAGAREWNWIKFKRSYSSKIEDTVDCLVMGYDYGQGKRTDFGIGAFLVGVYDEKNDRFLTVSKIGTGLTDEEWREMRKRCNKLKSEKQPALYEVNKIMDVDAWVKPGIVVEIKADEITLGM
ncbi:ATP-dependent DNA ligase [Candidatus Microgenomates bacterium]|nr:ATP-dependent DNA ligase [Candidatus Microgenomates bacterium]